MIRMKNSFPTFCKALAGQFCLYILKLRGINHARKNKPKNQRYIPKKQKYIVFFDFCDAIPNILDLKQDIVQINHFEPFLHQTFETETCTSMDQIKVKMKTSPMERIILYCSVGLQVLAPTSNAGNLCALDHC